VATPADRNVVQKEAENKLKYKSLGIEIQQQCAVYRVNNNNNHNTQCIELNSLAISYTV
jgi:hypothetical protein